MWWFCEFGKDADPGIKCTDLFMQCCKICCSLWNKLEVWYPFWMPYFVIGLAINLSLSSLRLSYILKVYGNRTHSIGFEDQSSTNKLTLIFYYYTSVDVINTNGIVFKKYSVLFCMLEAQVGRDIVTIVIK